MKTLEHGITALFVAALASAGVMANVTAAAADVPADPRLKGALEVLFDRTPLLFLLAMVGLGVIITTCATLLIIIKRAERWKWNMENGWKLIKPALPAISIGVLLMNAGVVTWFVYWVATAVLGIEDPSPGWASINVR